MKSNQGITVDSLVAGLSSRTGTTVLKRFDSPIFRGVSVESHTENLDTIRAMGSISNAWKAGNVEGHGHTKRDAGLNLTGIDEPPYYIHNMTGVDKLHARGIFGKGVKIALVDTGVDYTHPAVRFYLSFRVCRWCDLRGSLVAGWLFWNGLQGYRWLRLCRRQ